MKIEYVTGNPGKFREAQLILAPWELEQVRLDLPEIQGDPKHIVTAKAQGALALLQRPLLLEDVSVQCEALNGLPGPYVKDFLIALGETGLSELVHKYDNHSATVVCMVAFAKPGAEPVLFEGVMPGRIVAPRGNLKHDSHSWNTIFQPDGFSVTFGEMTFEQLSTISMRYKALMKVKQYLETHESDLGKS